MNNEQLRMPLNLQWFAKDGEGGEKTEEPTSKKLTDARNDGKVAKSKELDNAVGLLLLFVLLQVMMSYVGNGLIGLFDAFYGAGSFTDFTKGNYRDDFDCAAVFCSGISGHGCY